MSKASLRSQDSLGQASDDGSVTGSDIGSPKGSRIGVTTQSMSSLRTPRRKDKPIIRSWPVDNFAQTEASFFPVAATETEHIEQLASKQWLQLHALQATIKTSLTHLGGVLYDVIAWKNIAFKQCMSPGPLTDLVLLVSKLHRTSTQLVQQLTAFFGIVFSEGVCDETFHFQELRLTRNELHKVAEELKTARAEITTLRTRVKSLEVCEAQHRSALEKLEATNDKLECKSASLEDQMSILFEQLADDFIFYNEELLKHALADAQLQERLAPVRSAFSQNIDSVQQRLRFFEDMLADIAAETQAEIPDEHGRRMDRSKLKSLEIHLHHMINRMASVRDGLQQTAHELYTALLDKKKVVNFSLQHLKAYEACSNKLRAARSKLFEMRQVLTSFSRGFEKAFPVETAVRVDSQGNIFHVSREKEELAVDTSIPHLKTHIDQVITESVKLADVLSTTDEHRQLMKTVAMSMPSGPRRNMEQRRELQSQVKAVREAIAVKSSEVDPAKSWRKGSEVDLVNEVVDGLFPARPEGEGMRGWVSREEHLRMKEDYNTKVSFLREVYEDRIRTLESKTEMLVKKLISAGQQADDGDEKQMALEAKRRWLQRRDQLLQDAHAKREAQLNALHRLDALPSPAAEADEAHPSPPLDGTFVDGLRPENLRSPIISPRSSHTTPGTTARDLPAVISPSATPSMRSPESRANLEWQRMALREASPAEITSPERILHVSTYPPPEEQ